MDFPRNQFWMLAIVLAAFWGLPNVAAAQENEEPIEAPLIFTQGMFGPELDGEFWQGENLQVLSLITGIRTRPEDKGRIDLSMHIWCESPSGEKIVETNTTDIFVDVHGSGQAVISTTMNPPGRMPLDVPYMFHIEAVHQQTGQRFRSSREVRWKPLEGLTILQPEICNCPAREVSAGSILEAGVNYTAKLRVKGMTFKNSQGNLRFSLQACDAAGNPFPGITHQESRAFDVEEEKYIEVSANLKLDFLPNRAGKFILRAMVEDLNSGTTATRDIPVTVVSAFDERSPEATSLSPGELKIETQLTDSKFGRVRQSNVYDELEKLFASIRISGLPVDAEGKGALVMRSLATDQDGKVLLDETVDPLEYVLDFGGNERVLGMTMQTPRSHGKPGKVTLKLEVRDVKTGATGSCTQEIIVQPGEGLRSNGHWFSLDREGEVPTGSRLQYGRPYAVHARALGFSAQQNRIDLEVSMQGVDRAGKVLSDFQWKSDETVLLSRYSESPPEYIDFVRKVTVTRPGAYALRLTIRDKQTGKTVEHDIPVDVIGYTNRE